jgi:hypothetical protein
MGGAVLLLLPQRAVFCQQDPPRQDCCFHTYSVGTNLGWGSSLLNHVLAPGELDTLARAAVAADLRRAADHVVASQQTCSSFNPIWKSSSHPEWLREQALRVEHRSRVPATDREIAELIRETYQWGSEVGTAAVGYPVDRTAITPSCDEGYFRLGFLFGYASQSLRLAKNRRDQGRPDWQTPLEDARAYLQLAASVLDVYYRSPQRVDIDNANAYTRISRMLAARPEQVDWMVNDADSLWQIVQIDVRDRCAVLPGRIDAAPQTGYCVLRRPDLYQPAPGPPRCFEFYLADASVQDESRMASILGGACGATSLGWRQGWRPDTVMPGPFPSWLEGDQAMTLLSRYGGNLYACGVEPNTVVFRPTPNGGGFPPPRPDPGPGPQGGVISVSGGLDPQLVAQKIAGHQAANLTATIESSPVNLEIELDGGRAVVNQQLVFNFSVYNPVINELIKVEFRYALQNGAGTRDRVSGSSDLVQTWWRNGQQTRQDRSTQPWNAIRQPDGSYKFNIENGIGGWYAPIPYILR